MLLFELLIVVLEGYFSKNRPDRDKERERGGGRNCTLFDNLVDLPLLRSIINNADITFMCQVY